MSEITQFLVDLASVAVIVGVCIAAGVALNLWWLK